MPYQTYPYTYPYPWGSITSPPAWMPQQPTTPQQAQQPYVRGQHDGEWGSWVML